MLVNHKRDYNMRMQVADSVRYREAVTRLKRILYDAPTALKEPPRSRSPFRDRKTFADTLQNKDDDEKEFADKGVDESQKSLSSLFDMIKKQDDLIAQLEKENIFLKNELVSTAEASKEVALQNEAFRKRLTDTLIQMEASPDISYSNSNDKTDEIISCLKEERERLVECIQLQEETIAVLRQRETEAIDKVKQSVSLAEDSQKLTDKVREGSEQNRKVLQTQVEDAFSKIHVLTQQLSRAHEKERDYEVLLRDHEKSLFKLEEDRSEKDLSLKKRDLDYKNQIEDLTRSLKEAQESNHRLEKLLHEQRNTAEGTFKRLEALLDRRNLEAESFSKRKRSLENQVTDLRQENARLLQAINDLAKDRSSVPPNVDDKSAEQRVSTPSKDPDETRAREEIQEIKATVLQHHESISNLQDEVTAVRQEMTQEIEGLRVNIEEFCSNANKEESEEASANFDKNSSRSEITLKREPPLNSPWSEGYESMKEASESQVGQKNEGKKDETTEDISNQLISIPFSHKIRSNGKPKKVEIDLEKKEVDETEDDVTLSSKSSFVVGETKVENEVIEEKENKENAHSPNHEKEQEIGEGKDESDLNEEVSLQSLQKENDTISEDEKEREETTIEVSQSYELEGTKTTEDDDLNNSAEYTSEEQDTSLRKVVETGEIKKEESKDTDEINIEEDKKCLSSEKVVEETVLGKTEEESSNNIIIEEKVPEEKKINEAPVQSSQEKEQKENFEEELNKNKMTAENSNSKEVVDVAKSNENNGQISDENLDNDIDKDTNLKEEKKQSFEGNENKDNAEETSQVVTEAEESVSIEQSKKNEEEKLVTDDESTKLEGNTESENDSKVTTEILDAVVGEVGEETEKTKDDVEVPSQTVDSIISKDISLPDETETPNNSVQPPNDESKDSDEKVDRKAADGEA